MMHAILRTVLVPTRHAVSKAAQLLLLIWRVAVAGAGVHVLHFGADHEALQPEDVHEHGAHEPVVALVGAAAATKAAVALAVVVARAMAVPATTLRMMLLLLGKVMMATTMTIRCSCHIVVGGSEAVASLTVVMMMTTLLRVAAGLQ